MIVYDGTPGSREPRVSLTAPDPLPPPARRPIPELEVEVALRRRLVDEMATTTIPQAERADDRLAEALGRAQGKLDDVDRRLAAAQQRVREAQRRDGQHPQWAWVLPQGAAASFGLDEVDRLQVERQAVLERDWQPSNLLWLAQQRHTGDLKTRLGVERQVLAALEDELAQARAAEALPAPDPERPGGRLHGLRRTLTAMGVPLDEQK